MMDISNFDLSVIYTRPDGSFVVNKGLYHVPNEGEWEELYAQVSEFAAEHPDVVMEEPKPEVYVPTFEELQSAKLTKLTSAFTKAEEEAYLTSSYGFVIDADRVAYNDIDGLINLLEADPTITEVAFCCYDNSVVMVTLEMLNTMQLEVIKSGNMLYQQKWAIRDAINAAETEDELNAISIQFVMADFSA